ncbi:prepilin-type N-terminal cleavage/methylation domain-containing protein, partial [bacterium]|nr:prepilin-type N-terminal cleavage/methylation domain-containing protein [bacterium]
MDTRRPFPPDQRGFTLVELMVVIVIVGLLVAISVPAFSSQKRNAQCGVTAAELRTLSTGFVAYLAEHGSFPADSHEFLPPGMDRYIDPQIWADGTPLGGSYNWEGPDHHGHAALSIFGSTEEA